MESVELVINILVGAEAIAALVVIGFVVYEVRFLNSVRAYLPDHSLPLFEILVARAKGIAVLGAYLIGLTMVGAIVGPITMYVPWIRPLNGLAFLWLLAGPILVGRALRDKNFAAQSAVRKDDE